MRSVRMTDLFDKSSQFSRCEALWFNNRVHYLCSIYIYVLCMIARTPLLFFSCHNDQSYQTSTWLSLVCTYRGSALLRAQNVVKNSNIGKKAKKPLGLLSKFQIFFRTVLKHSNAAFFRTKIIPKELWIPVVFFYEHSGLLKVAMRAYTAGGAGWIVQLN